MRKVSDYQFEWSGLGNRLAQMFDPKSGHTVMLAVDHPYFQGVTQGLEDIRKTIAPLLPYCDAISPTIGGLSKYFDPSVRVPIILRATGGNSMTRKEELDDEIITVSIEEILRANAIGFTTSVYVGFPHQKQTIQNMTRLTSEGHRYGLVSIGITAVGDRLKELQENPGEKLRLVKHASRLLAENGADIIKTYYCEGFEDVVESCPAPIIIAGGTKQPTKEALEFTYNAIKAGAVGVDMGRNIFQNDNPVAMIRAVRAVVHERKTADEAFRFYNSLVSAGQKDAAEK